ncbi:MAG TPA: hypothetical protein VGM67_05875 [Gemmatimonadaceae bacterium]|jgi:hypothetical protein
MRPSFRYLSAAVAVLALAACGESTAPKAASSTHQLAASAPAFDFGGVGFSFGQRSTDFTITSNSQSVSVNGLFTLEFPSNSCPKLSGSNSCERSVKVHAVTQITSSGVVVDFSPHLTFAKAVTLSSTIFAPLIVLNHSYFASHPSALNALAMYYSPSLGANPVEDFASDPSLMTHVNLKTGLIYRSIWHFSGYLMGGGECDPNAGNPDCIYVDDGR